MTLLDGLPAVMRAAVLTRHGDLDALVVRDDWPAPRPGLGEVLVRVGACGLNATDLNTRIGWYTQGSGDGAWAQPLAFPRVQGADVCGKVVALGAGAEPQGELLGRRVLVDPWLRDPSRPEHEQAYGYLGSERDGGYAEYVTVPATNAHPVESVLSDVELASFATSAGTAENLLRRAGVVAGETVLVVGASGGVGTALVELVRARGAVPVALCSPGKADGVLAVGADAVLDPDGDLREQLHAALGRADVDVVADVVGGPAFPAVLGCLRRFGRYTVAGAVAGPVVPLDLRSLYLGDLTVTGVTVPPPGMFADLVGAIERGELRPHVAATFPLEQVREAQAAFAARRYVGKLVLEVTHDDRLAGSPSHS
ncbi:MAG: zinc-binding dehydrogenase [Kineosporiaceae bacterium]